MIRKCNYCTQFKKKQPQPQLLSSQNSKTHSGYVCATCTQQQENEHAFIFVSTMRPQQWKWDHGKLREHKERRRGGKSTYQASFKTNRLSCWECKACTGARGWLQRGNSSTAPGLFSAGPAESTNRQMGLASFFPAIDRWHINTIYSSMLLTSGCSLTSKCTNCLAKAMHGEGWILRHRGEKDNAIPVLCFSLKSTPLFQFKLLTIWH